MVASFWSPLGIAAVIGWLIYRHFVNLRARRNLPPGPKPLPIVGNALDFPGSGVPEFQHWLKHKDLYGGVSSVTVMGLTLIILHDNKAARYLLDQNAVVTSSRPSMYFANILCGYGDLLSNQNYGDTFRRYRKLLHRELGTKSSVLKFSESQEVEVKRQLLRALNEPEKWIEHYKTSAGATILKMTYDYTTEPHKPDVLVELIERMMNEFSQAAVPLAWPVDLLPVLRYLPEYLPGVQFKKVARKWRRTIRAVGYIPYRYVLRQMAANSFKTSYTSKVIQQLSPKREGELSFQDQEAVVWTAASLYGGASDTTVVVLTTFTLAMIMFPHVQQKAHEELDQVVGRGRLPGFEDRDNLPYINAIVKEAFRWWPIAPMGFPHMVDEELEYNGLRIPKGAFLIPAVWSFLHDPEVYANPHAFEPERFLSPRDEPDPSSEAFGYGRRICPGRFFADASIYLNIVSTLAAFRIDAAVDKEGKKIPIDVHATAGILNHPSEFKFKISLRSPEYDEIIRRVEVEHPWEKCDVDLLEGDGLKPE